MNNKKKPPGGKSPRPAPAPSPVSSPGSASARSQPAARWIAVAAMGGLIVAAIVFLLTRNPQPDNPTDQPWSLSAPPLVAASYVGGQACAACHSAEYQAWKGSHHDLAMQVADEKTVLGNFNDAKFSPFRRHLDLLPPQREVLRQHRRSRWHARRLRDQVHVRLDAAAAVSDRVAGRSPAGVRRGVGLAPRRSRAASAGSICIRIANSRRATRSTGPASTRTGITSAPTATRQTSGSTTTPTRSTSTRSGRRSTSRARRATDPVPITSHGQRRGATGGASADRARG